MESMQGLCAARAVVPLRLDQVGLTTHDETPVNLLTSQPKGFPCGKAGRVEEVVEEFFESVASRLRLHDWV